MVLTFVALSFSPFVATGGVSEDTWLGPFFVWSLEPVTDDEEDEEDDAVVCLWLDEVVEDVDVAAAGIADALDDACLRRGICDVVVEVL